MPLGRGRGRTAAACRRGPLAPPPPPPAAFRAPNRHSLTKFRPLRAAQRKDVHTALREAGYDDVFLGKQRRGGQEDREGGDGTYSALLDEAEFAHHCRTVVMNAEADKNELVRRAEESAAAERDPEVTSFIQKAETLVQGAGEDSKQLDCDCETYKCHCKKQCFCRIQSSPFGGQSVPNPTPPKESAEDGGKEPSVPDHEFKCTCSFDGVGGGGADEGGTMDCDCKVADCTCERQCVCRGASSASFRFKSADAAGGESRGMAVADESAEDVDSQTY